MQVWDLILPVIVVVFLWWFTTGLIMAVYNRSYTVTRLVFVGVTVVMLAAMVGLILTRNDTGTPAVYAAFTCGVLVWGWQTAGFYLGFVTGPQQPPENTRDWQGLPLAERFRLALNFSIHHEWMALLFALLIAAITLPAGNRWGLWIYLALWLMHTSAKVNVFLGVRNFQIDLLPDEMRYVDDLLTKRTSNELFPFSILVASSVVLMLIYHAIMPGSSPEQSTGSMLVATMIALGVFEHAMMVLPIPAALWGWGIRILPDDDEKKVVNRKTIESELL